MVIIFTGYITMHHALFTIANIQLKNKIIKYRGIKIPPIKTGGHCAYVQVKVN